MQNKYVGSTRFYDIQLENNSTQFGYTWYSEKTWGTGLNEHCKLLLLSFAFETIGFERVEFRADNRNKRSIAAMQKIGCTVEGILRNHLPTSDGTRRDSIVLSMLKNEWPTIKAGFLARIKMLDQNKYGLRSHPPKWLQMVQMKRQDRRPIFLKPLATWIQ